MVHTICDTLDWKPYARDIDLVMLSAPHKNVLSNRIWATAAQNGSIERWQFGYEINH